MLKCYHIELNTTEKMMVEVWARSMEDALYAAKHNQDCRVMSCSEDESVIGSIWEKPTGLSGNSGEGGAGGKGGDATGGGDGGQGGEGGKGGSTSKGKVAT